MGVKERRAREREELRTRVLEGVSSLFVEQGYASVTIRAIAERIEYAPSTIDLDFKDKPRRDHHAMMASGMAAFGRLCSMLHGITSLLIMRWPECPWVERERLVPSTIHRILRAVEARPQEAGP